MNEGVLFIQMFDQTPLLVISLWLFYSSSSALRCTTNCSFLADLTTPFSIPDHCDQLIEAGKCRGSIYFWFDRDQYEVYFQADPSPSMLTGDNKRSVLLDFSSDVSAFSYSIDRACNNEDDCAQGLIIKMTNEILKHDYNYTAIMAELEPLVTVSDLTPQDPNLQCYNSNETVQPCGTSFENSACVIKDSITEKKVSISCDSEVLIGTAYVSIYQDFENEFALFDVHCHRSLCNTRFTLDATKQLTYKYNITLTPDGRLDGSRLITSSLLIIMMILFLFCHSF